LTLALGLVIAGPLLAAVFFLSLPAVESSPRGRRMDMTRIANVMLFAAAPLPAGEFYITRIALE
jgi:hypothetical protein